MQMIHFVLLAHAFNPDPGDHPALGVPRCSLARLLALVSLLLVSRRELLVMGERTMNLT